MSLKWISKPGDSVSKVLVDSQNQPIAELFEVEMDAWHWNVLDTMYGVANDEETAERMVYDYIGIRPER